MRQLVGCDRDSRREKTYGILHHSPRGPSNLHSLSECIGRRDKQSKLSLLLDFRLLRLSDLDHSREWGELGIEREQLREHLSQKTDRLQSWREGSSASWRGLGFWITLKPRRDLVITSSDLYTCFLMDSHYTCTEDSSTENSCRGI